MVLSAVGALPLVRQHHGSSNVHPRWSIKSGLYTSYENASFKTGTAQHHGQLYLPVSHARPPFGFRWDVLTVVQGRIPFPDDELWSRKVYGHIVGETTNWARGKTI